MGIRVRVVVDSYCLKGPVLLLSDIESLMMPYKSEPYLFWCAPKTVTVRSFVCVPWNNFFSNSDNNGDNNNNNEYFWDSLYIYGWKLYVFIG